MKQITDEHFQKIVLLDKIFGSVSVEQLRELSESEQIVARLKGSEDNPQLLLTLIHERDLLAGDNVQNKNDILSLKADLQSLIKALNNTIFSAPYSAEFNNLKNKHGVY